jgi:hypothetical protein
MPLQFTPWNRILLEKLRGLQLVKKLPAFYRTQEFLPLSQRPPKFPYSEPDKTSNASSHFCKINFYIMLPSKPRSSKCDLSSGLPTKTLYDPLVSPKPATCPAHFILLDHPHNIWRVQVMKLCVIYSSPLHC